MSSPCRHSTQRTPQLSLVCIRKVPREFPISGRCPLDRKYNNFISASDPPRLKHMSSHRLVSVSNCWLTKSRPIHLDLPKTIRTNNRNPSKIYNCKQIGLELDEENPVIIFVHNICLALHHPPLRFGTVFCFSILFYIICTCPCVLWWPITTHTRMETAHWVLIQLFS